MFASCSYVLRTCDDTTWCSHGAAYRACHAHSESESISAADTPGVDQACVFAIARRLGVETLVLLLTEIEDQVPVREALLSRRP
eukprot:3842942-Rhodomonas_salina.2